MMFTGFTSSKDGNIPMPIRWLYQVFLNKQGYIAGRKFDYSCLQRCDISLEMYPGRVIEEIKVIGTCNGTQVTMHLTVDHTIGTMDFRVEQSREYMPVYTLGNSEPVDFIPRSNVKRQVGGTK